MTANVKEQTIEPGRVYVSPVGADSIKGGGVPVEPKGTHIRAENFSVFYHDNEAVKDITMEIPKGLVTAIIGPSGCGKSTYLRAINRMNDLIPGCRAEGLLALEGQDLYAPNVDVVLLRRRVGMVFQTLMRLMTSATPWPRLAQCPRAMPGCGPGIWPSPPPANTKLPPYNSSPGLPARITSSWWLV